MEHAKDDTDQPIILRIYRLPSGLWGGRLFAGEEEIGVLGAYESVLAVEQAAGATGLYPDHIEIEADQ